MEEIILHCSIATTVSSSTLQLHVILKTPPCTAPCTANGMICFPICLLFYFCFFGQTQCVVPENIHTSPTEGIFFLTPPHPSGNSRKASYISLYFLIFQIPQSPGKFQSLLWGKYGYFLELHNAQ